ncbi:MAG: response regulator transcription factor [Candidatus Acidiferrales bacterium]|jgi:DNA-binding NarL/FixJ family response regulator
MPTRILIADDHEVARASLKLMIGGRSDWTLVAQAADGAEAVEKAKAECPDVAVLDIQMPELDGIQAAQQILAACPRAAILAISLHEPQPLLDKLKQMGVRGFVPKRRIGSDLVPAIETILNGGLWFKVNPERNTLQRGATPG